MQERPNILIIVVDSLRWDHVSCYGYERETTPNIDRLASEGCRFENCITAAPFSPASYASLMSNLYPHQHGVNGDTVRVWPESWPRLAEKLKEQGYFTFCISNNSFLSEQMNGQRGFDVFVEPQHPWWLRTYSRNVGRVRQHVSAALAGLFEPQWLLCRNKGDSEESARRAAELIRDPSRGSKPPDPTTDRPFFGFLVLMDPHAMFHPARRRFVRNARNLRRFLKEINGRQMWSKVMARRQTLDPELLEAAIDLYDGEIAHADACVGRLYDTLRDADLLDDTVFAVAADHGEAFGEHGVWGHGFCLNECLCRVPLVIRAPRCFQPGSTCGALVQLHDLHDLCMSVAHDQDPASERFPNCLTQASDPSWLGRSCAYSEFPVQTGTLRLMKKIRNDFEPGRWGANMWAVRTADWRLIEYGDPGAAATEVDLFDLRNDPQERVSCHEDHPSVVESLRAMLAEHRSLAPRPAVAPAGHEDLVDEAVVARLRDLGYID